MKKLKAILIVIILSALILIVTNYTLAQERKPDATLDDIKTNFPVGEYKYEFSYGNLTNWDNICCVRRGGTLSSGNYVPAEEEGDSALHRLTTYVEINGNNAKFFAGDGHSSLPEGTLIYESNCVENNILAAILYEGYGGVGTVVDGEIKTLSKQDGIWYFWDDWLDASVGTEVTYIKSKNGWIEALQLPNGLSVELSHSGGLNKNYSNLFGWGESFAKDLATFASYAAEKQYSVTFYHFADKPGDGTKHQHVILSEKHDTSSNEITVTKTWKDGGKQNYRAEVKVQLYEVKNGVEIPVEGRILTLNKNNNWTGTFKDLPRNNNENEMIYYTVKEINCPEGYISKVYLNTGEIGSNSSSYEIVNILKTKVTVKKEWQDYNNKDGRRPESITVTLYSDAGKGATSTGKKVELNDQNNWTYTFENLNKYDLKNREIKYTIKEDAVSGYATTNIIEKDEQLHTIVKIINKPFIDVKIFKVWEDNDNKDGLRPSSIEIQLYKNGKAIGDKVTLDGEPDSIEKLPWMAKITGLDKYDENGNEIEYTVKEENMNVYEAVVTGNQKIGFIITNTLPGTRIEVTKIWDDDNNRDGKRPDSLILILKANGKEVQRQTITAKDNGTANENEWKYAFTGLPVHENGKKIIYTVEEIMPEGYEQVK